MYGVPAHIPDVCAAVPPASYPPHSRIESLPGSLAMVGRLLSGVVFAADPVLPPELDEPQPPSSAAPPRAAPAARKSRRFTCCMCPLLLGLSNRRQARCLRH